MIFIHYYQSPFCCTNILAQILKLLELFLTIIKLVGPIPLPMIMVIFGTVVQLTADIIFA